MVFHLSLLGLMLVMWPMRFWLFTTPNNVLHSMGLGSAVAFDTTVGALAALVVAILSLRSRRSSPSGITFALTQILAWTYSIGFWLFLLAFGWFVVANGMM